MPKKMKSGGRKGRGRQRSAAFYGNRFVGCSGVVTLANAVTSTYWMNPSSSYGSTFLGFTNVIPGIFGNRVNLMSQMYKQFRIVKLEVDLPPPSTGSQVNQQICYTPSVGDLTTSLLFPNNMEYGAVIYSGATETVTRTLRVPKTILDTGLSDWYMVEENPGTTVANPASDPNLSSHGLLIINDSASFAYAYVLRFTILFQAPEDPAQVEPRPSLVLSSAEKALLESYRRMTLDEKPTLSTNLFLRDAISVSRKVQDPCAP